MWRSNIEVLSGVRCNIWLTSVMDSKFCKRLDNFLGPRYQKEMQFWEYKDTGESEVKEKGLFERSVPMANYIYRNFLGAVDQRDVEVPCHANYA